MENPEAKTAPPADEEAQTHTHTHTPTPGVQAIVRRWKREDLLKNGSLILRSMALLFSLLSFIIMATNKHGYGRNFDQYEEYRYLLAIGILSFLYTAAQVLRQLHLISTGIELISKRTSRLLDFFGDQLVAYLLISAASTAIPMTNRMREGADNIFTDSCAASISMAFFAFFSLALSAMISGFQLSNQTYI
ncbi:hypothetical protein ACHQM5_020465 [Ranunculus cassubicifolius]